MSLKEVRDTLLQIAHPAVVLQQVDDYMELLRKHRGNFELPYALAWTKPLFEFYTEDLPGWIKFVRHVRDKLNPEDPDFKALQAFNEKLGSRMAIQRSRELVNLAMIIAVRKGLIEDTPDAKARYAKRCKTTWALRRKRTLANARMASSKKRLSLSEQDEVLKDFWENLELEINNGEIPPP